MQTDSAVQYSALKIQESIEKQTEDKWQFRIFKGKNVWNSHLLRVADGRHLIV